LSKLACKYTTYFSYTQAYKVFFTKKLIFVYYVHIFFYLCTPKICFCMKFLPHKVYVYVFVFVSVFVSCSRPTTPKPYGYFRLDLPEQNYVPCTTAHAQFAMNQSAKVEYIDPKDRSLFNIYYPGINATIHCTCLSVHKNLPDLLRDAQEMVYSHAVKASAIPEQEYKDLEHDVYGMLYELQGNTATPAQFYVTDSTSHFFRASVYINTIPNQDSLAPVIDYLIADTRRIIETFRWRK